MVGADEGSEPCWSSPQRYFSEEKQKYVFFPHWAQNLSWWPFNFYPSDRSCSLYLWERPSPWGSFASSWSAGRQLLFMMLNRSSFNTFGWRRSSNVEAFSHFLGRLDLLVSHLCTDVNLFHPSEALQPGLFCVTVWWGKVILLPPNGTPL